MDAEREPTTADPGDPAAEHVELLAGDRLGRIGKEGEVDVGHLPMLAGRPRQREVGHRA